MWVSKDKDEFRQVGRVSDWNNILENEQCQQMQGLIKITHLIRSNFVQLKHSLEMEVGGRLERITCKKFHLNHIGHEVTEGFLTDMTKNSLISSLHFFLLSFY